MNKQNAPQATIEAVERARASITEIENALRQLHIRATLFEEETSWAHAGSAAHIASELADIARFARSIS